MTQRLIVSIKNSDDLFFILFYGRHGVRRLKVKECILYNFSLIIKNQTL
jgi:hypothetical protein